MVFVKMLIRCGMQAPAISSSSSYYVLSALKRVQQQLQA